MRYLIPFNLFEALDLPLARKVTRVFLDSGGKNRYNEYFKGKDRIYYDFLEDDDLSYTGKKVKRALSENGYEMISYFKGLCKKISDPKNTLKIQRILNKLGMVNLKNEMDRDQSRSSSTKGEKQVVISRHGIDLAGASTDRDWTSCRDLTVTDDWDDDDWDDDYRMFSLNKEIEQGSLIAYLIDSNDTNINNPIARIMIAVFINKNDPNDIILYPDSPDGIYGNAGESFMDFVKEKCLDITRTINPKFSTKRGIISYKINPDCYSDDWETINKFDGDINTLREILDFADNSGDVLSLLNDANININMKDFFDMVVSEGFTKTEKGKEELNSVLSVINQIPKNKNINILDALEITENKISEFIRMYSDVFAIYLKSILEKLYDIKDAKSRVIIESYITIFNDRIGGEITLESIKDFWEDILGYKSSNKYGLKMAADDISRWFMERGEYLNEL